MTVTALGAMLRIRLRTGWRSLVAWVVGLGATMLLTTTSISGLYDTPAKRQSYADAIGKGDALVAINGRVAGLDSLGGIVANEFGFVASFAIPLMAIGLVAAATRKDEERGRLEALLAGRIGRSAPLVSALVLTAGALLLTGGALLLGLVLISVPADDSLLYAASMVALGLVFAGVAAVAAQLVEHTRGVYAIGLGTLVAAYLLRGIGDVQLATLAWLSPLGWQEKTRAFGDAQWWPLVIPCAMALALAAAAVFATGRRDLGSAMIRRGGSSPAASPLLRTTIGTALHLHRGAVLGWSVGAVVLAGMFGSLAKAVVDAIAGNASLAEAMGAGGATGLDAVLSMSALFIALIAGGYAVQGAGVVRHEEASGRLESALAGARTRGAWLAVHLLVVALGAVVVMLLGGLALGLSAGWSTGEPIGGTVARAVASYLPAVVLVGAVGVLLFGAAPRLQPLAYLVFAAVALVAYLGDALGLSDGVQDLSPFHWVGSPPQSPTDTTALAWLSALAIALVAAGFVGFRRRDVPAT
jgi:ABC-2 type transport system permease protein